MAIWEREGYTISIERQFLDIDFIHHFLSVDSYWAKGIPMEIVRKSIEHSSVCFGVYEGNPAAGGAKQIGFARVLSDFVRFAYIMDVFISDEYRGRGLSKWLMEILTRESELKDVSKMMLCTYDAHRLYEKSGFQVIDSASIYMERKK